MNKSYLEALVIDNISFERVKPKITGFQEPCTGAVLQLSDGSVSKEQV